MISCDHVEVEAAKKVLGPNFDANTSNDDLIARAWAERPFEMIRELGKLNPHLTFTFPSDSLCFCA